MVFHRKLPFPAPLCTERYLLPLTLEQPLLRCLCFAWPEHKLLTPARGQHPSTAAASVQLLESATSTTSSA